MKIQSIRRQRTAFGTVIAILALCGLGSEGLAQVAASEGTTPRATGAYTDTVAEYAAVASELVFQSPELSVIEIAETPDVVTIETVGTTATCQEASFAR